MLDAQLNKATIAKLIYNGFDFASPDGRAHTQTIRAFDHTKGPFSYGPLSVQPTLELDGAGDRCTFNLVVTNNNPGTVTAFEVNLGKVYFPGGSNLIGLPPTQSVWVTPSDPPIAQAHFQGGEFFVSNEVPDNRVTMRLGSRENNGLGWTFSISDSNPLPPGSARTHRISYRFAPAGTAKATAAPEVLQRWSSLNAPAFRWDSNRPVGALMLASVGFQGTTNPSGWLNERTLDTTTPAGRAACGKRLADKFQGSIYSCKRLNAQALIVWDVEGASRPGSHYFGDVRQVGAIAPEMDAVLDGAIKAVRDAGLIPGFMARDAVLMPPPEHDFVQRPYINEAERLADLHGKFAYLAERFGDQIWIYLDSWAGTYETMQALQQAFPKFVISPEMPYPAPSWYRVCLPFVKARFFSTGTSNDALASVPTARTLLALDDVKDPNRQAAVTASIKRGDIGLFRSMGGPGWDDWDLLVKIYQS